MLGETLNPGGGGERICFRVVSKRFYNVYLFVLSVFSFVCGYMILRHGYGIGAYWHFSRRVSWFEVWLLSMVFGIAFMVAPALYWYHGVRHLLGIQKRANPERNS